MIRGDSGVIVYRRRASRLGFDMVVCDLLPRGTIALLEPEIADELEDIATAGRRRKFRRRWAELETSGKVRITGAA